MRITGGRAKGRRLAALKGLAVRPTSDLVRQAIFNLVGQDMGGFKVLDLFAGTGCLGIEALSRGAEWALFVDRSTQAVRLIRDNLQRCGYENSGEVLLRDLRRGLPRWLNGRGDLFDLVFMDPPYGKGMILPLLEDLREKGVLAPAAVVVTETSKLDPVSQDQGRLKRTKSRIHGETKIDIYSYGEEI